MDIGDCQCPKKGSGMVMKIDLDRVMIKRVNCSNCGSIDPYPRKLVKIVDYPPYEWVLIDAIEIAEGEFDPNVVPESNSTV